MDPTADPTDVTGVDVHAHYFGADMDEFLPAATDPRWPVLVTDTAQRGTLMLGDTPFRTVRSVLWDVEARIAELDAAAIAVQLVSPVPVTLAYWADRPAGVRYARACNDSIAAAVQRSRGRLAGLGTVPLPHVDAAIEEMHRAVEDLGLCGVEIGTQIAGEDLDSPRLLPFFAAAEALNAALFVHPTDGGGGVLRRGGQPYDFGLAMITDTAVAATALVFGGVLDRHPGLRIALAHGCGTFAWAYPRLRLGAQLFDATDSARVDELVNSLWVDSLVFDPEHLRLLTQRFGAGHVMLGTDYPFVAGQLDGAREFLSTAHRLGALDADTARRIHGRNGHAFLAGDTRVPALTRPPLAGGSRP